MGKALSYMMIGALCSGAAIMFLQNREDIKRGVYKLKRDGMRTMNRFKAMM